MPVSCLQLSFIENLIYSVFVLLQVLLAFSGGVSSRVLLGLAEEVGLVYNVHVRAGWFHDLMTSLVHSRLCFPGIEVERL